MKTTLVMLQEFPDRLEYCFAMIPVEHKHWTPGSWDGVPSEALTAIEQICHVRDIEIDGYQRRIERTLREDRPFLPSIDTYALARERRYEAADAAAALSGFRSARQRTLAMLAELGAAELARTADFEGYGPVSLRSLVHFLCSHDQQHLAGLQWLSGKIAATA
jgi:hypothetical protein